MASKFPNVKVSAHPVMLHKLAVMRQEATTTPVFRQLLRELSYNLGYVPETTTTQHSLVLATSFVDFWEVGLTSRVVWRHYRGDSTLLCHRSRSSLY